MKEACICVKALHPFKRFNMYLSECIEGDYKVYLKTGKVEFLTKKEFEDCFKIGVMKEKEPVINPEVPARQQGMVSAELVIELVRKFQVRHPYKTIMQQVNAINELLNKNIEKAA